MRSSQDMSTIFETDRLILRTWKLEDRAPFLKINQDPKVMEFLRAPFTAQDVEEFIHRMETQNAQFHYMGWAVELKATGALIGAIGLHNVRFEAHFTPAVEILWRLGSEYWGQGLASEGAKATLEYAFDTLHLPEVVAYTVPRNLRSQRVMDKIGLKRDFEGDFLNPSVSPTHPLAHNILYRAQNPKSLAK